MNAAENTEKKSVAGKAFLVLLLFVGAAATAYWWFSNHEHPLKQADSIELCKLLPNPITGAVCSDNKVSASVAAHSVWTSKEGQQLVMIDVVTTQNLSQPLPMTSKAWLDAAIPEIKASGRQDIAAPIGPWSNALITRSDKQQELLFEDKGVVVIIQSDTMDRNALLAYAALASKAMRKAPPVAAKAVKPSSPAAATPQS
jgi:hypothetical protein